MSKLSRIIVCFHAVLMSVGYISVPCLALDDGDFQSWSSVGASFDINKDWKCTFDEEFRIGDDAGELYYHHSDLGFVYKSFSDWIDLGFNYRQVFARDDSESEWTQENRPHLNITLKGKLFDLDVSNRGRFEYRDREDKKDLWRYRNKFTVKLPFELTELKLQPYLADEVFFDLDGDGFKTNRLYSGFSFKLSEKIKCGVYYLWQSSESGDDWKDTNVLGAQLRFSF